MNEAIEKSSGVAKSPGDNTRENSAGDASQSQLNYRKMMQEKVTWHELEDERSEVTMPQLSVPFASPRQYFGITPKSASKLKDKVSAFNLITTVKGYIYILYIIYLCANDVDRRLTI